MSRRIIGTELEFGAGVRHNEHSAAVPLDQNDGGLMRYVPEAYAGFNQYLRNGGRFYFDAGGHPEYATSEDDSVAGAVANELAGDRIAYATMQAWAQVKGYAGFELNRRVVDEAGMSWGYHENYSCTRKVFGSLALLDTLSMHLATRSLYAGAGALDRHGSFVIAQKAQQLTYATAEGTTGTKKPLISTRDEPHADSSRWGRIHVVGGDPNMSPWATWLKLGTTALVIDMIEGGYDTGSLEAKDNQQHFIAKQVATDLTMEKAVELRDGKTARPIEIQTELCQAARKMSERIELSDEQLALIDAWEKALTDLESGGPDGQGLIDRADWPMRLAVLNRCQEKSGTGIGLANHDFKYDTLHPSGYGMRFRQKLWRPWMPDEAVIADRTVRPASTTRAATRSRFIDYVLNQPGGPAGYDVDWTTFKLPSQYYEKVGDPFDSSTAVIDELIARDLRLR